MEKKGKRARARLRVLAMFYLPRLLLVVPVHSQIRLATSSRVFPDWNRRLFLPFLSRLGPWPASLIDAPIIISRSSLSLVS